MPTQQDPIKREKNIRESLSCFSFNLNPLNKRGARNMKRKTKMNLRKSVSDIEFKIYEFIKVYMRSHLAYQCEKTKNSFYAGTRLK